MVVYDLRGYKSAIQWWCMTYVGTGVVDVIGGPVRMFLTVLCRGKSPWLHDALPAELKSSRSRDQAMYPG